MSIISLLLAIAKAIPIVDKWIQTLVAQYVNLRIETMRSENIKAIRSALIDHDQRELERSIGSKTPGEVSGDAGAVIVDKLPGVE